MSEVDFYCEKCNAKNHVGVIDCGVQLNEENAIRIEHLVEQVMLKDAEIALLKKEIDKEREGFSVLAEMFAEVYHKGFGTKALNNLIKKIESEK